MNISIFGLGYVGCVSLGVLAELGHNVIGVDISDSKVKLINSGKSTIVEAEIEDIIKRNFDSGRIRATTNPQEAVEKSEIAIICVGTPNDENGHLDMEHILAVSEQIGLCLKNKNEFFTIAIRSTVMPGTNKSVSEIIEKSSNKKHLKDFAVVNNPEFLREGTAVKDFLNPPYTILASDSPRGIEQLKKLYKEIKNDIIVTSIGTAELIKFVNNSFHALKVNFANEVGRVCKTIGFDGQELMELFVKDKVLNISPYYLKPGFPYGGSCLPKDLKALITIGHDNYVELPVLRSIEVSNRSHLEFIIKQIISKNKKNIGILGLSFKIGTDDLRFSPAVEIAEYLIGKGYNIKLYDKNVTLSKLTGKNRDFLFHKLPHIAKILIQEMDEFLASLEVLLIVNKDEDIKKLGDYDLKNIIVLDNVGIDKSLFPGVTIERIS